MKSKQEFIKQFNSKKNCDYCNKELENEHIFLVPEMESYCNNDCLEKNNEGL